jgi:predicted RNA-binding Zn ribbon-like protein
MVRMPITRPLTGEPLALDLVNTAWPDQDGWHDVLDSADDYQAWLHERGLDSPTTVAARTAVREGREAIRSVLEGPRGDAAGRRLDAILGKGRIRVRAIPGQEREAIEVPADWRIAWMASRDLLRLLDERGDRVRKCANPECVLWFSDTTRSGTRRWCSMSGCGNRLKARRHYRRTREEAGPDS